MKKLLVIISLLFCGLTCYSFETTSAQFPTAQMQSVNNFNSGVSHDYNITPVGAYSPNQSSYNSPNRVGPRKNNGIEHGENGNPNDPYATPVGDIPFGFMLSLCLLVILYKQFKKNDVKYIE